MGRVWVLLAVVGCAGCAVPRAYFQQPRLVVGAPQAEWAPPGSLGAVRLRGIVRQSGHTLIWENMAGAGLLEGVSLGDVDAGLVRDSEWDCADPAADWIEAGAIRNGYHLLVSKGAGQESWILRWDATPELVAGQEDPESSDAK